VFSSERSKLYLVGGEGYDTIYVTALQDLWTYDLVTDAWQRMNIINNITQPRFSTALAALSHSPSKRILIFGGVYITYQGTTPQANWAGNELIMLEEIGIHTSTPNIIDSCLTFFILFHFF
jgi:hypothetical protein